MSPLVSECDEIRLESSLTSWLPVMNNLSSWRFRIFRWGYLPPFPASFHRETQSPVHLEQTRCTYRVVVTLTQFIFRLLVLRYSFHGAMFVSHYRFRWGTGTSDPLAPHPGTNIRAITDQQHTGVNRSDYRGSIEGNYQRGRAGGGGRGRLNVRTGHELG